MASTRSAPRSAMSIRGLPGGVVALGFVSLFMDVSSEMIHSLLPVFLVSVLGASALAVGVIEGIAESTSMISRVFSGAISDWIGRRKPLLLAGYGFAALVKPLFPLADSVATVLFARFADRIGKGVRGAPRDALVADLTAPDMRGAAYGLRQSMDTVGAFMGPVVALVLMMLFVGDFRLVFWVATVPALISVAIIVAAVHEPDHKPAEKGRFPLRRAELVRLDRIFWLVVGFAAFLSLARFSEAFLLLRATDVGLKATYVPVILVVMNVVYAATAYPVGVLADRVDRKTLLAVGVAVLIASDVVLAAAGTVWLAALGAALWGLHMGATQGLVAAVVADAAPGDMRGTAFGTYNLVAGLAALLASIIAGGLWSWIGPAETFIAGAVFATVGVAGLMLTPSLGSAVSGPGDKAGADSGGEGGGTASA